MERQKRLSNVGSDEIGDVSILASFVLFLRTVYAAIQVARTAAGGRSIKGVRIAIVKGRGGAAGLASLAV